MYGRTLLCFILLVLLPAAPVWAGVADDAYPLGELDVVWKQPIAQDQWSPIPEIPLTYGVMGKGHLPPDFGASFFVAWHKQGLILRVLVKDGDFQPPASDPKLGTAQPYLFDSVEFRFNSHQFVLFAPLEGRQVAGYPAPQWKGKQALLDKIDVSVTYEKGQASYLAFFPWDVLTDTATKPSSPVALAVGVNERNAAGCAQLYSPSSFLFDKPGSFAICVLSDRPSEGPALERWERAGGLVPQAQLVYDSEGFLSILLEARPGVLDKAGKIDAQIGFVSVRDPQKTLTIEMNGLQPGFNRLSSAAVYAAFDKQLCRAGGRVKLGTEYFPLAAGQCFFPVKGGFREYQFDKAPPEDMRAFWDQALKEAREVPLEPKIAPYRTHPNGARVFEVILNGIDGIQSVGYLTLPPQSDDAKGKRWPCLIYAPGYGGSIAPIDMSARGLATFAMNVRGQGASKKLHDYKADELLADGIEDRKTYYYRFVYTDFVRASEFLATHAEIDPDHLGITGGSQGASIALAVAGLSPRIKFCAAVDPGFCGWEMICDLAYYGYKQHRVYGYFYDLADKSSGRYSRQDILRNLSYFDVAFLCQWITCPTVFVNDHLSYPETTAVAFHNIPAKDKVLITYPTGGHCFTDDQYQKVFDEYLKKCLGGK